MTEQGMHEELRADTGTAADGGDLGDEVGSDIDVVLVTGLSRGVATNLCTCSYEHRAAVSLCVTTVAASQAI